MGTVRPLNPTDCVKGRLVQYYLENVRQCREQALDLARQHKVIWRELKRWHGREGFADRFGEFKDAVTR